MGGVILERVSFLDIQKAKRNIKTSAVLFSQVCHNLCIGYTDSVFILEENSGNLFPSKRYIECGWKYSQIPFYSVDEMNGKKLYKKIILKQKAKWR